MSETRVSETGPSLAEVLREHRGATVPLYLNRGNAGDALVNQGARRLLVLSGLTPVSPRAHASWPPSVPAFLVGAGGFSGPFHHNADLYPSIFAAHGRVYVLPSSFDPDCVASNSFLRSLPPHVVVFCRERYSFRHARALSPYPGNIAIDHDAAFHYRYDPWRSEGGSGTLLAFRDDPEGVVDARRLPNLDVSLVGDASYCRSFLGVLSSFAMVHTDRLHVAIAAAAMGKKVSLYPNSYWKNRGVYEHSLAANGRVEFVERREPAVRGPRWWILRYAWEVARHAPPVRRSASLLRQHARRMLEGGPRDGP